MRSCYMQRRRCSHTSHLALWAESLVAWDLEYRDACPIIKKHLLMTLKKAVRMHFIAYHCISLHFIAFLHLLNVQTSANKPFRSTPGRTYVSGEDWRKELLLLDLLAVRGRDRAPRNIKIISKCPRFMVIMTGFFPTVVADFQATAHLEMYWQWS